MKSEMMTVVVGVLLGTACAAPSGSGTGTTTAADTNADTSSSEWCHDYLSASDNETTFSFDYQDQASVQQSSDEADFYVNTATPAWVNVWRSSFTGRETAQAVVLVYGANNNTVGMSSQWRLDSTLQVPLSWNGSAFTGQVPAALNLRTYQEGDDIAGESVFQFALVVDGTWLTDPVSGTHNFTYTPAVQGTDSYCRGFINAVAPPPADPCAGIPDGNYCGGSNGVVGEPYTLYICSANQVGTTQYCENGCSNNACK